MDDVVIGNRIYFSTFHRSGDALSRVQTWDTTRHVGKQFTSLEPKLMDAIYVTEMASVFCVIVYADNSVVLYTAQAGQGSAPEFIFSDRFDATGARGSATSVSMFTSMVVQDIRRARVGVLITYVDADDVVYTKNFPIFVNDIDAGYITTTETTFPVHTSAIGQPIVPTLASTASVWPTRSCTRHGAPSPPRDRNSTPTPFRSLRLFGRPRPGNGTLVLWVGRRRRAVGTRDDRGRVRHADDGKVHGTDDGRKMAHIQMLVGWYLQSLRNVCRSAGRVEWLSTVSHRLQNDTGRRGRHRRLFLATPVGFANLISTDREGFAQRRLSVDTSENSVAVSSVVLLARLSTFVVAACFANDNTKRMLSHAAHERR